MCVRARAWPTSVAALVAGLGAGCATAGYPAELVPRPSARLRPADDPYHGPPLPALQALVRATKADGKVNHFCVIGYRWSGDQAAVWVHWEEERRLLLWRDNEDAELRVAGLVQARRTLRFGEDTVASPDELQGSTYRVTEAWWRAVVHDCRAQGERFVVPAPPPA
jgi:hypothetical protein